MKNNQKLRLMAVVVFLLAMTVVLSSCLVAVRGNGGRGGRGHYHHGWRGDRTGLQVPFPSVPIHLLKA